VVLVFGPPRPGYKAAHVINQGKCLGILHHDREIEPGPLRGQTVKYVFILPLSYPDPGHEKSRQ